MYSHYISYPGFCSTEEDQIHYGATLYVTYPILPISFLLMPWWPNRPECFVSHNRRVLPVVSVDHYLWCHIVSQLTRPQWVSMLVDQMPFLKIPCTSTKVRSYRSESQLANARYSHLTQTLKIKCCYSLKRLESLGWFTQRMALKKFHQHVWRCIFVKQKVKKPIKYSLVH